MGRADVGGSNEEAAEIGGRGGARRVSAQEIPASRRSARRTLR